MMPVVLNTSVNEQTPAPTISERIYHCVDAASVLQNFDLNTRHRLIDNILSEIGSALSADRAYLFRVDDDGLTVSNINEWCGIHVIPYRASLQRVPTAEFRWWMAQLRDTGIININSIERDIPAIESYTKSFLKMQGVKSLLVAATERERELTGFVGIECVRAERIWSANDLMVVRLLAVILGSL